MKVASSGPFQVAHPNASNKFSLTVVLLLSMLATISGAGAEPAGRVIDLTHRVESGIPTYFLDEKQRFKRTNLTSVQKDGFASGMFCIPEHYGTHVDAPAHIVEKGDTIDALKAENLILPAVVIDVRKECAANADYMLTKEKIVECEKAGKIPAGSAILLMTGWSSRYSDPKRYRNADSRGKLHFPGYSPDSVRFLTNDRKVKALGIDTLSVDTGTSLTFAAHSRGLSAGIFFMENLDNLDKLPARGAMVFCGALPIKDGSGSPARVLGFVR